MAQPIHTGRDLKAYLHEINLSVYGDACLLPPETEPCDECNGTGHERIVVHHEVIEFDPPIPCGACRGSGVVIV